MLHLRQVAGHKVKCMLAEPKGKRGRTESAWSDSASPALHVRHSDTCLALVLPEQLDGLSHLQGCRAGQAVVHDPALLHTTYADSVIAKALTGSAWRARRSRPT